VLKWNGGGGVEVLEGVKAARQGLTLHLSQAWLHSLEALLGSALLWALVDGL